MAVRARHRDYYLMLAEEIRPKLQGSEQAHWLAVLEEEHDNLRLAQTFCLEEPDSGLKGLRLAAALRAFWWIRGHLGEGRERLKAVLSCPEAQERSLARADVILGAGILAYAQGDYVSARSLYEESLTIRRELGDRWGIALSLGSLGTVAHEQCDYASARSLQEESLTIRRELGDRRGVAYSLEAFAALAVQEGRAERAARLWGAASALRDAICAPLPPNERERNEQHAAAAWEALGEAAFSAAWAEGRTMAWEQAVAYALARSS